jgi:hypothetical protein
VRFRTPAVLGLISLLAATLSLGACGSGSHPTSTATASRVAASQRLSADARFNQAYLFERATTRMGLGWWDNGGGPNMLGAYNQSFFFLAPSFRSGVAPTDPAPSAWKGDLGVADLMWFTSDTLAGLAATTLATPGAPVEATRAVLQNGQLVLVVYSMAGPWSQSLVDAWNAVS